MAAERQAGVRWDRLQIAVIGGDERDPEIARLGRRDGGRRSARSAFPGRRRESRRSPWPIVLWAPSRGPTICSCRSRLGWGSRCTHRMPSNPSPLTPSCSPLSPQGHTRSSAERLRSFGKWRARSASPSMSTTRIASSCFCGRPPSWRARSSSRSRTRTSRSTTRASSWSATGTSARCWPGRFSRWGRRVHVAARNPIQRANAYADGATPLALEGLPALAPSARDGVFDRPRAGGRSQDPRTASSREPRPRHRPSPRSRRPRSGGRAGTPGGLGARTRSARAGDGGKKPVDGPSPVHRGDRAARKPAPLEARSRVGRRIPTGGLPMSRSSGAVRSAW